MHTPALPLYSFFISLQQHTDFSLGIAEYECLLSVLEKQPDMYFNHHDTDRKQLLRLCELLWLKPNQNSHPNLYQCQSWCLLLLLAYSNLRL